MSLMSLLKQPDVRAGFHAFCPQKPLHFDWEWLAPPLSPRPQLIGTAFDYLFRFHLERLNESAFHGSADWVARNGLEILCECAPRKVLKTARSAFETAQGEFYKFQKSGVCGEALLAASLHLARLEEVYRGSSLRDSPVPNGWSLEAFDEDIADLRGCLAAVPWEQFAARQRCRLNPTFGLASALVGGADADFCLDEVLFELKTVRHATVKVEFLYQLLGYVLLYDLGGFDGQHDGEIVEIAVYFPRFGQTVRFELAQLIGPEEFRALRAWFVERATHHFGTHQLVPDLRFGS